MQKINQKYIKTIVQQALREDLKPSGDITTKNIQNRKIIAKIIAKQECLVGGLGFAEKAFKIIDRKITFKIQTKDGRKVKKGKVVAVLEGMASGILKGERVALNFLGLISGVATNTNKFVKKVKNNSCKIFCTRKTLPNLRMVQKYGVRLGGGINHRFNLSDEVLIKDNHIALNQDIRKLVEKAIKNKKGKKITVEIDNLSQLKKIMGLKFDRVLFDNMNLKNLKKGVKICKNFYETEASGGININNITKFARTGVKRISVGQLTHSAPMVDFSLDFAS